MFEQFIVLIAFTGSPDGGAVVSEPSLPSASFREETLAPFLRQHCIDCHSGADAEGGVSFDSLPELAEFAKDRSRWMQVVGQLRGKGMPPEDAEQPSEEDRKSVADWIQQAADYIDCSSPRDPGHVTMRRLNRVEYNNTIRDLVGVDFRPADDFPSDDVGEGFDNIGDVLSISPILIEKYLAAAEKIAEKAIVIPRQIEPIDESYRAVRMRLRGSGGTVHDGSQQRMTGRGELYKDLVFPAHGEYEFTIRAYGEQAGSEPVRAVLKVGRKKIGTIDIPATHEKPGLYKLVGPVEQGKNRVSLEFVNDYFQPDDPDPAKRGDRNMVVETVRIQGPVRVFENANPDSHSRIFIHPVHADSKSDDVKRIIENLTFRAFRRPPTQREIERLTSIVELAESNGEPVERGIQLVLEAVLASPHFLFRVELDDPDDPSLARNLSDFELASRLSYFLWSSMPDDALFELARSGELTRGDDTLRREVQRMIQSERVAAFIENFAGQWLQLRNLEDRRPDKDRFPEFNRELRRSMRLETEHFFGTILQENRSIDEFLVADYTFVDERLAKHYGIPDVKGNEFRRVSVGELPRGGVLTHASILTVTSDPTRTSPVKRGKWIMETLLGTPPPNPPANVPELATKGKKAVGTIRERMEAHRANPACATCHETMDPLGFGLENFNAIGVYRDKENDVAIDASGTLPDGSSFRGPRELAQILVNQKDEFVRNLAERMLTYALGRGLNYEDRCVVREIVAAVAKDEYHMGTLVWEIVKSDPFRKRRGVAREGNE